MQPDESGSKLDLMQYRLETAREAIADAKEVLSEIENYCRDEFMTRQEEE